MSNFNLNIGGLIGAVVVGGLAAAVVFSIMKPDEAPRLFGKLIIFALIGGAAAGNFAWAAVFSKK